MDPRALRSRRRALEAAQELLDLEGLDAITHARVAHASGLGRRTLYRHWPDRSALLHATLSLTQPPAAPRGNDLRSTLLAHLQALRDALDHGPLAYIVAALFERSTHDPDFDLIRDTLVNTGCAPLKTHLADGVQQGVLPHHLDPDGAIAVLEGPVFYGTLLHRRSTPDTDLDHIVDAFLTSPPTRAGGR